MRVQVRDMLAQEPFRVALEAGPFHVSVTHAAELDASGAYGGGYKSLDWEVFGDEYFAKKEWIKEDGEFVEAGTFKLHHTPGA